MSLGAGSFTIRRFQLLEANHNTPLNWIIEKIKKHFISPLKVEDIQEEASGFCHPFTGESNLNNPHSLIYDNALLFALRLDKKKIPATFLKLQLQNALESLGYGQEDEQGRPKKIAKKIRDSLKDKLKEELLRMTVPSVRLIEILWHLDSNEIWLFSSSTSVIEEFEKIFLETFELQLVQINAGTLPVDFDRLQLGLKINLKSLLELEPVAIFHEKTNPQKNRAQETELPLPF